MAGSDKRQDGGRPAGVGVGSAGAVPAEGEEGGGQGEQDGVGFGDVLVGFDFDVDEFRGLAFGVDFEGDSEVLRGVGCRVAGVGRIGLADDPCGDRRRSEEQADQDGFEF